MNIKVGLTILSFIISIVVGFTLSKSGESDSSDKLTKDQIVIGLSMDTLKEARWQRDRDYFIEKVEAMGGKVLVQSANSDDTRQIQDVRSLISSRVDVLVIIPHNGAAMATAVKEAHKAGIPVVAYDRLITDCDLDLYISFDNEIVGEEQAKYLIDKLGGEGNIVRLYGAPTDNNAKLFKQGQDNILDPLIEKGAIRVVHDDWVKDWDPANAKRIMNAAITKTKDFDGVLASNDGSAGGAIQSMMEAGLAGKVPVTGQDADLVACQRIVNGTQAMTIYKPIKSIATSAAELAYKMATGKPVIANSSVDNGEKNVPSVLLEVTVVTKENLKDTVIADGYHSEEAVFDGGK
ncbi:MAG: substrate-binding domain-containing protein [Lentisphaeria bacterium]|nr:substrate-binding domain-containing protein [Lentisphaeria bacterium]